MIEHQMDAKRKRLKTDFRASIEEEKTYCPRWMDVDAVSIFFSRIITKSKSFRMNKLHAWVAPFCFYIRCVSIDAHSLALFLRNHFEDLLFDQWKQFFFLLRSSAFMHICVCIYFHLIFKDGVTPSTRHNQFQNRGKYIFKFTWVSSFMA